MHLTNGFEGLDDYSINLIRYKTRRLIGQAGYTRSDIEDIEQDLALHLRQVLPRFNPARGTLKTFVNFALDNKIRTMISARLTQSYDVRLHDSSLDEAIATGSGDNVYRRDIIDEDDYLIRTGCRNRPALELVELRIDVHLVLERLPDDLRELCELWLKGETTVDISRKTGVPRHRIYESRQRLRAIFREHDLDGSR